MIVFKNLYHRYIREYYALYDINLKIEKGEKVSLVGEDDSGKTSLIRILSKLEKPSSGEVYINGKSIKNINFKTDISVGYLPVCPIFLNRKTVYDNLKYILKSQKITKEDIDNKINDAIKVFDLEEIKNKKIKELTLFEKYIVSIARLSLRKIDLLLVDNVFEGLEDNQINILLNLIEKHIISKENTVIIATSCSSLTENLTTRKIYFKSGSIVDSLED